MNPSVPPERHSAAGAPALVEVADGVFAYLQPPGGWCLSNAGIIRDGAGAMVIDTLATERRARALVDCVDRLSPGPRRLVVNTHHHGDHNFGNHLFGDAATIIAHEQARAEMEATGLALTTLWPDVDWGDVRVTLPTVTFQDRLTVHLGDRRAELIYVGAAHTTNDVVVWLPAERVLFAGDVVLSGEAPFMLMGSIAGSIDALNRLRALEPERVVCGHGPVADAGAIDVTLEYLTWIQSLAKEAAGSGLTPLEAARQADRSRFAELGAPERIVGNLHRAYAELGDAPRGVPLDVVSIFREMVEFNDGKVPECLA